MCRRLLPISNIVQKYEDDNQHDPRRCRKGLKGFGRKGKTQTYVNLFGGGTRVCAAHVNAERNILRPTES